MDVRVRALETLLTHKGYVDPAALDAIIETYETRIGPHNGAAVVARAWTEPDFRHWLLPTPPRPSRRWVSAGARANTWSPWRTRPNSHNMVVCTLCSCYPWPILGLPPVWYKSAPYRARAVQDPRSVLQDFGVARCRPRPRSASGTPPPRCVMS
jgi:nitrile hydratase